MVFKEWNFVLISSGYHKKFHRLGGLKKRNLKNVVVLFINGEKKREEQWAQHILVPS